VFPASLSGSEGARLTKGFTTLPPERNSVCSTPPNGSSPGRSGNAVCTISLPDWFSMRQLISMDRPSGAGLSVTVAETLPTPAGSGWAAPRASQWIAIPSAVFANRAAGE